MLDVTCFIKRRKTICNLECEGETLYGKYVSIVYNLKINHSYTFFYFISNKNIQGLDDVKCQVKGWRGAKTAGLKSNTRERLYLNMCILPPSDGGDIAGERSFPI